ncbi:hypothetical protein [Lentibacillus salinarum]|uniref:Uncharacterized protein n=1 Tax=Lentibacillus salinarum TaxID=446820 RepID=A0ABW3ZWQ6_9BACI
MSKESPLRIKLNKEQTLKLYSICLPDARRIANERKRKQVSKK